MLNSTMHVIRPRKSFPLIAAAFIILITASTCRTADTAEASLTTMEQQVFQLVNQYRHQSGLKSLTWDESLADIARTHSRNMADGNIPFGHDGFSQRVAVLSANLNLRTISENVGMTSNMDSPARVVVDGWAESPTHAKNLTGSYQLTGVGAAKCEGSNTWYFTQIFVEIRQ